MFQKNPGIEKVFALPEEDITIFWQVVARFPVESFIVSQHQFFRRETLQCFRKNWVSEKFMHDGVVSRSSIETFQSRSTATLRGEHLCVSKIVWYGKNL